MSFNTSLSGLTAASSELDVISNNVANASTIGFKKSRAEFADVYANSALGSSGNAIGSGVLISAVTQQFSQGEIGFTNNNLDLSISGQGFFILDTNGVTSYTRAGAFGVDRNGFIANSANARLTGFLADSAGNITGGRGDLEINTNNLAPTPTTTVGITVNLDGTSIPPVNSFISGFTPSLPPDPTTYNSSTSTTIYDSLGNAHVLTTYFVKAHAQNTWHVHIGVDATDFTPAAAPLPSGTPPQPYLAGSLAQPYTIVFNDLGEFVPNSVSSPTVLNPLPPVASVLVPAGPFDLTISENIPVLALGDLVINGIPIDATNSNSDPFSTVQIAGSAISLSAAINASSQETGVTATVNPTSFTIGTLTSTTSIVLNSGDLVIDGSSVTGSFANLGDLVTYLNTSAVEAATGVTASAPLGALTLSASNGRNIQVQSSGASSATFSSFNTGGGSTLNQVQRANITITTADDEGIHITGNDPLHAGLIFGQKYGIIYSTSDPVVVSAWTPGTGAVSPQPFDIQFGAATQFGAPFSVEALDQNGFSTGRLSSVNVQSNGTITANYSNGQSLALGQIALANFSNVQGLSPLGNSSWAETFNSGSALVGSPATANLGTIEASALENSNVDLPTELVNLIVAQRNFQANAQTIRTDDAITQTIINLR